MIRIFGTFIGITLTLFLVLGCGGERATDFVESSRHAEKISWRSIIVGPQKVRQTVCEGPFEVRIESHGSTEPENESFPVEVSLVVPSGEAAYLDSQCQRSIQEGTVQFDQRHEHKSFYVRFDSFGSKSIWSQVGKNRPNFFRVFVKATQPAAINLVGLGTVIQSEKCHPVLIEMLDLEGRNTVSETAIEIELWAEGSSDSIFFGDRKCLVPESEYLLQPGMKSLVAWLRPTETGLILIRAQTKREEIKSFLQEAQVRK